MKKTYSLLLFLSLFFISCGSPKKTIVNSQKTTVERKITDYAKTFLGTKYKYGGNDRKGMDCSGLVYTVHNKYGIQLPRSSRQMAKMGKKIPTKLVKKGDLLFFKTAKNRRNINHVGIVLTNKQGEIRFIHTTTSRGVIISKLSENYWKKTFEVAKKL